MITRQVPWSRFDQLVPDELAEYRADTLAFLNTTMRTWWPEILDERGMIEAALRRDRLIAAECTRLAAHARGPVIAAGSTGSMPATARFLHAVAALRQGALVLPGLDTVLDDAAWNAIQSDAHDDATDASPIATASVSHPQFALRGLLARLHLTRADVVDLSGAKIAPARCLSPKRCGPPTPRRIGRCG